MCRNHIVSAPERSRCEKFVATKSRPSCWFASCRFNAWFVKSRKISRPICASRHRPSWRCKRRANRTWLVCSRTPTCALFTPNVWRSCQRTFSWLVAFVANALKRVDFFFIHFVSLYLLSLFFWFALLLLFERTAMKTADWREKKKQKQENDLKEKNKHKQKKNTAVFTATKTKNKLTKEEREENIFNFVYCVFSI